MSSTLDVPADLAATLAGDGRARVLEAVRARLAADRDAMEGWRSSIEVATSKVTFHRGLATGFAVALKPDLTPSIGAPPAFGRARLLVEVEEDSRLFGLIGVPVFLLTGVGGAIFVIVWGEPVLGAMTRGLKKLIFGAVLVIAVVAAAVANAIVERILTAGKGNEFRLGDAKSKVVAAVAQAVGGRASDSESSA
jgi:hypothetical protein